MINVILFFLSGIVIGNGVPHYVKGITGRKHKTPFKKPTSATGNVIWGSFNFLAGVLIIFFAISFKGYFLTEGISFVCGLFITGILLAFHWQNDPEARGE